MRDKERGINIIVVDTEDSNKIKSVNGFSPGDSIKFKNVNNSFYIKNFFYASFFNVKRAYVKYSNNEVSLFESIAPVDDFFHFRNYKKI